MTIPQCKTKHEFEAYLANHASNRDHKPTADNQFWKTVVFTAVAVGVIVGMFAFCPRNTDTDPQAKNGFVSRALGLFGIDTDDYTPVLKPTINNLKDHDVLNEDWKPLFGTARLETKKDAVYSNGVFIVE